MTTCSVPLLLPARTVLYATTLEVGVVQDDKRVWARVWLSVCLMLFNGSYED